MRTLPIWILAAAALAPLGGCAYQNPGLGDALHQNLTAQIADPDAKYAGDVPPGANGSRTSLAQTRYQKGLVLQPADTATTSIRSSGGAGK